METGYLLYNPLAGTKDDLYTVSLLESVLRAPLNLIDITRITDYRTFFRGMEPDDFVILSGGDGTLNRFLNDTQGIEIPCHLLYYPNGSGNDFARELGKEKGCNPFPIGKYIEDLPTVTIGGKTCRFLNGIGYGIDGYCCQVGDRQKQAGNKAVNYTAIAMKGLLKDYKPVNATVTVDGVTRAYKKVWLAPTMYGKFYGGGMIPAPGQKRGSGELSVMVYHNAGKLRALTVFPSIFKGGHIKHTGMVEVLTGRQITVEFEEPRPLQIDGETVLNVTSYTACAPARVMAAVR